MRLYNESQLNTRKLANNGQAVEVEGPNKGVMVARAFKGMTPAEFRAYVDSYASTTQAAGFKGMTYAESFYKPVDEFNMSSADKIVLGEPLEPVECGQFNKPASIEREIGKRPIIAFDNSKGDYSMLNYAKGNPVHPGPTSAVTAEAA